MLANFGNCPRSTVAAAERAAQQAYAQGLGQFCSAVDAEKLWSQGAQVGDPLRPYRRCSPPQYAELKTRYNRVVQARLASFCSEDRLRGAAAELACLRLGVRARVNPVAVIAACDSAMDGDSNELACIELSVEGRLPLERAIAACDFAMDGDANELQCIKTVANARYETSASIAACDSAMDGDANELQCIGAIATARRDSAQTILACDEAMSGDASELECIRKAVR